MKIQLLIILLFPLLLIGQPNQVIDTLSTDELQRRNGLLYKIDKDEPFTGIHADKWSNGQKKSVHHIADGKEYGISLAWNENGQITEQVDILNARRKSWRYEDNQKIEYNDTLLWSRNIGQWKTKSQTNYDINGKIIKPLDYTQIELKNNLAYTKLDNKPFTGVMTFQGELMLYDTHYYFKDRLFRGEVSIISGDFDGPYYSWYEENSQKRFEANLKNRKLEGSYTSWWYNGNKKEDLSYTYGRKDGIETTWFENGQIMSKGNYNDGDLDGLHTTWNINGIKLYEITYLDNKQIKAIIWDENGNKVKEVPEADKDNFGLRIFLDEFVSILKTRNYDDIEDLIINKENFKNFLSFFGKTATEKEFNDEWPQYVSQLIKKVKKQVDDDFLFVSYFENGTITNVVYDYDIINDDKSNLSLKWPESINYDIASAIFTYADLTLFIENNEDVLKIELRLMYLNNKWCISPMVEGLPIIVKY
jgi:antitoxin component YwqK of YwqJK toxin-antitoxin module